MNLIKSTFIKFFFFVLFTTFINVYFNNYVEAAQGYTGCNQPSIIYQLCSPCYPGDEGEFRSGFWYVGGYHCYGNVYNRLYWTTCFCPGEPVDPCDGKSCGQDGCGSECDSGCPNSNQCGMCGNPACCSVSAPTAPTLISPSNPTTLTRASTTTLTWSAPSSWGNDCNNAANYYGLTTTFNGVPTTINISTTSNTYSLGSCNSTVTWRVAANNGATWGPSSSTYTLTNTGFTGPTISNFSSTSSVVSAGTPITFTATAGDTDPNADIALIRYRIRDLTTNSLVVNTSIPCTGVFSTCTKSYTWNVPLTSTIGNYRVFVDSSDQCGYSSAVYTYDFSVAPVYNLRVNVDRLGLVIPDGNNQIDFGAVCSNVTGDFPNINVTYYAGGSPRSTLLSNSSGVVTFNNIPQADVNAGITLTATPSSVESCQSYNFYCYGENPAGMGNQIGHQVNFIGTGVTVPPGGTKVVTIGLGEEKKDSWETVFDGDIYARNANVGVSCTDATAGGGFETTTIVEDTVGGFFRTSGSLNSNATKDIYTGNDSGYAKDLDGLENNAGNQVTSLDAWFHNYDFPNMSSSTAPTITSLNFSSILGNRIYKSGTLSLSGTYNLGSSSAITIVYVDGDLTFTGNLNSTNGLVIFIVNGNVTVSSSIGVSNYTNAGTFTPTTGANITAGILGLNDVTFATNGTGDNPVILNGFIMNRGDIYFNRDLLGNNDRYPAHVIKFDTGILSKLYALESIINTGLATYDVQWIYDEN